MGEFDEERWIPQDTTTRKQIRSCRNLAVSNLGYTLDMEVFRLTARFTREERYDALTDQMRRSSRSVCTNIGEAWRKRRYRAAFIAKLNDSESEACETQVWVEFARRCEYLEDETCQELDATYDEIMGQIVRMVIDADKWLIS